MRAFKQSILISFVVLCIAHISFADDILYQKKEILRGGDFPSSLYDTWHLHWCDVYSQAAKDGEYGMRMVNLDESEDHYFFQMLAVPSQLDAAKLRFDYRAVDIYAYEPEPVVLKVSIAKAREFDSTNLLESPPLTIIGELFTETVSSILDWRSFSTDLPPSLIEAMQTAHSSGEYVFLLFSQARTGAQQGFAVDIDNISLIVDGTQRVPEMRGKIAYLAENSDGNPYAINLLDPNSRRADTIWTHPEGRFYDYSNVAWSPDASQLAFVSDHDFQFSLFKSNIYTIKPDGSDLQRIPRLPSQDEIQQGNYPKVTLKFTLQTNTSNYNDRYSIILGIQGTNKGTTLVASGNDSLSVTIPDVPVLNDPGIFDQSLMMYWSSNNCSGGVDYAFPVGQVINGTVDLGTVSFFGANCVGLLASSSPNDLSWNRNGTEIGFALIGLKKMNVYATQDFEFEDIEPSGSGLSGYLAWSPVDDRYLYCDFSFSSGGNELFIAEEGGEPQLLRKGLHSSNTPAWLPDGSGFVYLDLPDPGNDFDASIYQFDLSSGQRHRLTYFYHEAIEYLSISPDGRHIVFQMRETGLDADQSDLWILDRLNPVDVWRVTDSGNCRTPDWSKKDVVYPSGQNDQSDEGDTDANNGPSNSSDDGTGETGGGEGGGGGGCFITVSLQ